VGIGVERFGASAPGTVVLREYGFTVDNVCARAKAILDGVLREYGFTVDNVCARAKAILDGV